MKKISRLISLSLAAAGIAACGNSDEVTSADLGFGEAKVVNAYLVTNQNRLIGISLRRPKDTLLVQEINGLQANERILSVDHRNSEGSLYALTSSARIVIIDTASGNITPVSTLVSDLGVEGNPPALPALNPVATYAIDFNPVPDRLRIIGSDGRNLRVDVLTGETIVDGTINGFEGAQISGVAYTDSFGPNGRGTTLFSIDAVSDQVFSTNANAGTLSNPRPLGVRVSRVNGFDIDPLTNFSFAVMTPEGGKRARLYEIDASTTSNAARLIDSVPRLPSDEAYVGFSVITEANPTVTVLADGNTSFSFRAQQPEQISNRVNIAGIDIGDTLFAIDFRQSDRSLYALGSNNSVYKLSAGVGSLVADLVAVEGGAFDGFQPEVSYVADFNPRPVVADQNRNRLRLIGSDGSNAVVNIDAGNVTDSGNIKPTTSTVVAAAYSNNYRNNPSTQLFVIDRTTNTLNTQTVAAGMPADGTLTQVGVLSFILNPQSRVGFDISGRLNQNPLMVARSVATGPYRLYRLNSSLASAAASLIGAVGGASGPNDVVDIAVIF